MINSVDIGLVVLEKDNEHVRNVYNDNKTTITNDNRQISIRKVHLNLQLR